ncbi:MAG: hypothetical protein IPK94_05380 [Saprospiraceae bacterium]|nr:hypothetical protein [Saprospiraceae bacterium]
MDRRKRGNHLPLTTMRRRWRWRMEVVVIMEVTNNRQHPLPAGQRGGTRVQGTTPPANNMNSPKKILLPRSKYAPGSKDHQTRVNGKVRDPRVTGTNQEHLARIPQEDNGL